MTNTPKHKFQERDIVHNWVTKCGGVLSCNGPYTVFLTSDGTPDIARDNDKSKELCHCVNMWELIESTNNNNMPDKDNQIQPYMKPLEKFAMFFTKEPFKSARKAGVTNGDDMLTGEGANMFINWLYRTKYAEEFNVEVVQTVLVEKEKSSKK